MNTYDILSVDELFCEKHNIKESRIYDLEQNEDWKINLIKEITFVKRGLLDNGLESEVNKEILNDICTN